ncbi:hypothetical protein DFJ74DRAFT_765026 [Hyaloraphidium curvatum]|nr:hypothetical protein DFJ74DRAFT_765026 [Hyaloraphidium curvatum]
MDATPAGGDASLPSDSQVETLVDAPDGDAGPAESYGGTRTADLTAEVARLVAEQVAEAFAERGDRDAEEPPEVPAELAARVVASAGDAAVFVCLCAMGRFASSSAPRADDKEEAMLGHDDLQWSRSLYCELLAIAVLNALLEERGISHVMTHVLAAVYPNSEPVDMPEGAGLAASLVNRLERIGEDSGPESALEQGLECGARQFIEHKVVAMTVDAIWNGTIVYTENQSSDPEVTVPKHIADPGHADVGFGALFRGIGRLRVPANQVLVNQAMFLVFLVIYSVLINNRHQNPTPLEYAFFVFGISYTFGELAQVGKLGIRLYLTDSWNTVDILLWTSFTAALVIRIYTLAEFPPAPGIFGIQPAREDLEIDFKKRGRSAWVERYYDILSLMAVPLWLRILAVFNENEFVATTIITVQRLMRDSLMFLILLVPVTVGFAQGMLGLEPNREALDGAGFTGTFLWLLRGFIGDLDFDSAADFDPFWGPLFYGAYILLGYIILLNLLVAIFCESFSEIVSASGYQFHAQRTVATLQLSDRRRSYPFPVPLNVPGWLLTAPARLCLPAGTAAGWVAAVWWALCMPLHVAVAAWEEGRYWIRGLFVGPGAGGGGKRAAAGEDKAQAPPAEEGKEAAGGFAGLVAELLEAKSINQGQADHLLALHRGVLESLPRAITTA